MRSREYKIGHLGSYLQVMMTDQGIEVPNSKITQLAEQLVPYYNLWLINLTHIEINKNGRLISLRINLSKRG